MEQDSMSMNGSGTKSMTDAALTIFVDSVNADKSARILGQIAENERKRADCLRTLARIEQRGTELQRRLRLTTYCN